MRGVDHPRAAAALLAAGLVLGCGGTQAERVGLSGATPELVARRGEFVQRKLITGALKAVRSEVVTVPRNPTWQIQIRWLADDGASVSAGQPVVELDNSTMVSQLDDALLAELQAYDNLAQKEAELAGQLSDNRFQLHQKSVEFDKAAMEAEVPAEILGAREYQEKQLALERARAAHENARAELESLESTAEIEVEILRIALNKATREVEAAERAIDILVLRAPREGIFAISENFQEGRRFQIGDTAWVGIDVGRIPDLTEMEIEAFLDDVDDGQIKVGDEASCWLDAYPDEGYGCTVLEMSPIAQEATRRSLRRRFRVLLSLERTDTDRMRPGMSVKVAVVPLRQSEVVLAPRLALDPMTEPPRAFLRNGDAVDVQLGACNAADCVIEQGLEDGTRLGRAR